MLFFALVYENFSASIWPVYYKYLYFTLKILIEYSAIHINFSTQFSREYIWQLYCVTMTYWCMTPLVCLYDNLSKESFTIHTFVCNYTHVWKILLMHSHNNFHCFRNPIILKLSKFFLPIYSDNHLHHSRSFPKGFQCAVRAYSQQHSNRSTPDLFLFASLFASQVFL